VSCVRCGRPEEAHSSPGVTLRAPPSLATDRLALATRVKRARRASACPACHAAILPGMSIARLVSPAGWVHVGCVPAVQAAIDSAARSYRIRERQPR
jgi:hypothetical protein